MSISHLDTAGPPSLGSRREVTAGDPKVKRARELKAQGLKPADIGRVIGVGRATVYRYLRLESD